MEAISENSDNDSTRLSPAGTTWDNLQANLGQYLAQFSIAKWI